MTSPFSRNTRREFFKHRSRAQNRADSKLRISITRRSPPIFPPTAPETRKIQEEKVAHFEGRRSCGRMSLLPLDHATFQMIEQTGDSLDPRVCFMIPRNIIVQQVHALARHGFGAPTSSSLSMVLSGMPLRPMQMATIRFGGRRNDAGRFDKHVKALIRLDGFGNRPVARFKTESRIFRDELINACFDRTQAKRFKFTGFLGAVFADVAAEPYSRSPIRRSTSKLICSL